MDRPKDITRRKAIQVMVGIGCAFSAGPLMFSSPLPANTLDFDRVNRLLELRSQLAAFSLQILPRFVDGRGDEPAYQPDRRKNFNLLTLRLSFGLTSLDQTKLPRDFHFCNVFWYNLKTTLGDLYVDDSLRARPVTNEHRLHPAMNYLRHAKRDGCYAFRSIAPEPPMTLVESEIYEIALKLSSKFSGEGATQVICDAKPDDLRRAFDDMTKTEYLTLIEPLFLVRPNAPVDLLTLHTRRHGHSSMFTTWMSHICGNTIERLSNNYFGQALKIACLKECEGTWHPFVAGQAFDILIQKLIFLLGPVPDHLIRETYTADFPLSVARGVFDPVTARTRILQRKRPGTVPASLT